LLKLKLKNQNVKLHTKIKKGKDIIFDF